MKIFLTFLCLCITLISVAQDDSTKFLKVNTSVSIASHNVWRGVNYGNNTPTIQGTLALDFGKALEIGATGTGTLNGDRKGFGNWMELYAQYTIDRWALTVDDYYFFSYDSLNDYFNYSNTSTQHLIEAKLKYTIDKKFSIYASYNFYANRDAKKAWYFEAEYFLRNDLSILIGAVTGASWLNFYDAGGVTTIGLAGSREIVFSKKFSLPIKSTLIFNPNYKNIAKWDGSGYVDPGYNYLGSNPVNFVIAITF